MWQYKIVVTVAVSTYELCNMMNSSIYYDDLMNEWLIKATKSIVEKDDVMDDKHTIDASILLIVNIENCVVYHNRSGIGV